MNKNVFYLFGSYAYGKKLCRKLQLTQFIFLLFNSFFSASQGLNGFFLSVHLEKKKQALVYILQLFVYIFLCVQYLSFYIACSDRSQKNSTEAMLAVNSLNRYLAVFYFSLQKRNSKNDIWQFASFWLQLWAWEERFKIMSIFTLLNLRIAG